MTETYCTLAEAEEYFATRYGASTHWTGTDEVKEAALQTAYWRLRTFPGFSLPDTPSDNLKRAQCEEALFVMQQGAALDARAGLMAQGVRSSGIVGESYAAGADGIGICATAKAFLIADGLRSRSAFRSAKLKRADGTEAYLGIPAED